MTALDHDFRLDDISLVGARVAIDLITDESRRAGRPSRKQPQPNLLTGTVVLVSTSGLWVSTLATTRVVNFIAWSRVRRLNTSLDRTQHRENLALSDVTDMYGCPVSVTSSDGEVAQGTLVQLSDLVDGSFLASVLVQDTSPRIVTIPGRFIQTLTVTDLEKPVLFQPYEETGDDWDVVDDVPRPAPADDFETADADVSVEAETSVDDVFETEDVDPPAALLPPDEEFGSFPFEESGDAIEAAAAATETASDDDLFDDDLDVAEEDPDIVDANDVSDAAVDSVLGSDFEDFDDDEKPASEADDDF